MDEVIRQVQSAKGFSWDVVWDYIQENWMEILKLVLTVAIMLLDDEA